MERDEVVSEIKILNKFSANRFETHKKPTSKGHILYDFISITTKL